MKPTPMKGRLTATYCRCDRRLYEVVKDGVILTYCAFCDLGLPTFKDRHPLTHEPIVEPYQPRDWSGLIAISPIIILAIIVIAAILGYPPGG